MSKSTLANKQRVSTNKVPSKQNEVASNEPNYYPQIYMDLEKMRAKRNMDCSFKESLLSEKEKSKIKEITARVQQRSPLLPKTPPESKKPVFYSALSKNCSVPVLQEADQNKSTYLYSESLRKPTKIETSQTTKAVIPIDKLHNHFQNKERAENIESTTSHTFDLSDPYKKDVPEDLISTCRHSQTRFLISNENIVKMPKTNGGMVEALHQGIQEKKERQKEAVIGAKEQERAQAAQIPSHIIKSYTNAIAAKNENIELLRGTLLKSVKIIKSLLYELKKNNISSQIQKEALNFLADEDVPENKSMNFNDISEFLDEVNKSKVTECNLPIREYESPNEKKEVSSKVAYGLRSAEELKKTEVMDISDSEKFTNLDGMMVTFKNSEVAQSMEKEKAGIDEADYNLKKVTDSYSIDESLSKNKYFPLRKESGVA